MENIFSSGGNVSVSEKIGNIFGSQQEVPKKRNWNMKLSRRLSGII